MLSDVYISNTDKKDFFVMLHPWTVVDGVANLFPFSKIPLKSGSGNKL